MKMLTTAGAFALALFTCSIAIADDERDTATAVAERYLNAYAAFDTNKMAPLLSDDMVFIDPTKPPAQNDGQVFTHVGKEAVLAALGGYADLYKEFWLDYKIDRQYESNNVVVFIGDITFNILTEDSESLSGTAPIVTVVTVRDGKVSRHLDLYDYAGNAQAHE